MAWRPLSCLDNIQLIMVGEWSRISTPFSLHSNIMATIKYNFPPQQCLVCTNLVKIDYTTKRPRPYCSRTCANIDRANIMNKTKQTNLERYGHENIAHGILKEKIKQTNLERYGVANALSNSDIWAKGLTTNIERYGYAHAAQSPAIQAKITATNTAKYGHERATSCILVKQKTKQTNLERYGHENIAHGILKEKIKQTNLERYGVKFSSQRNMNHILAMLQDADWLMDQYITRQKTAVQIASELGINDTTVGRYLKKAEIEIRKNIHSLVSVHWLESIMESENIHIQHALNGGEYQIPGTRWKADGYCAETNTIYEFHGDYWHGNPLVYEPDAINEVIHKSMGELYRRTLEREEAIKAMGYNLVITWESDLLI